MIDHEDIAGLMRGMTMKFSVSDPELLRGNASGQVIDFRVHKDGNQYVVTEIRLAAAGEHPGGHGTMMKGNGGCCGPLPPCRHGAARDMSLSLGEVEAS
jgi:hypothetical protein